MAKKVVKTNRGENRGGAGKLNNDNDRAPGFEERPQPSPEAKKAGWQRKRIAQEFMDKITLYQNMTIDELNKLSRDMKDNPVNYTVRDLMAFRYASKAANTDKFLVDFMNRHVPAAPQSVELSGNEGGPITLQNVLTEIDGRTKGIPGVETEVIKPRVET